MYLGQEVSFPGFQSGQVGLLTTLAEDSTSQRIFTSLFRILLSSLPYTPLFLSEHLSFLCSSDQQAIARCLLTYGRCQT